MRGPLNRGPKNPSMVQVPLKEILSLIGKVFKVGFKVI